MSFLDTGSDISTLCEDVYQDSFLDIVLDPKKATVRGLEVRRAWTLGSNTQTVELNSEQCQIKFHYLPVDTLADKTGFHILSQMDVTIWDEDMRFNTKKLKFSNGNCD